MRLITETLGLPPVELFMERDDLVRGVNKGLQAHEVMAFSDDEVRAAVLHAWRHVLPVLISHQVQKPALEDDA